MSESRDRAAQLMVAVEFRWVAPADQMWACGEAFRILNRGGDLETTKVYQVLRKPEPIVVARECEECGARWAAPDGDDTGCPECDDG